jgi:OHCU decarboxylase
MDPPRLHVSDLNGMAASEFAIALQGIFEHSPWVAEQTAPKRPFETRAQLIQALLDTLYAASREQQVALLRAHPELASKAALAGDLTPESNAEQRGAGLTACSPQELEKLESLNRAYTRKFGHPFILAVRGHTRTSIIENLATRLEHDAESERRACLDEVAKIARLRLEDRINA